jgi:uncharacterized membrane protein
MKKYKGGKYSGKHSTVIEPASDLIEFIHTLEIVSKIMLGFISSSKSNGVRRIKIKEEPACLFVKICGSRYSQEFRIYSKNLKQLTKAIKEYTSKHNFQLQP